MQFSLKSMMIATLVVAVMCAFAFSLPTSLTAVVIFAMNALLPAVLTTAIVYGNSDQRAFAIGASATFVAMTFTDRVSGLPFRALRLLVVPAFTLFAGWLALRTRQWLLRRAVTAVAPPPIADPRRSSDH